MNNPLIIYSYTPDRLKEFKNEKKDNDIIVTALNILEKDGLEELTDDKNIYVDITNYYKSAQDNPIGVEQIINIVRKKENLHIIINFNCYIDIFFIPSNNDTNTTIHSRSG